MPFGPDSGYVAASQFVVRIHAAILPRRPAARQRRTITSSVHLEKTSSVGIGGDAAAG
jgi:hypothetical protein